MIEGPWNQLEHKYVSFLLFGFARIESCLTHGLPPYSFFLDHIRLFNSSGFQFIPSKATIEHFLHESNELLKVKGHQMKSMAFPSFSMGLV